MEIAVYFDLPYGGAARTMIEVMKRLEAKGHKLTTYHNTPSTIKPPFLKHLFGDLESIVLQRFKQKVQANEIDTKKYDLVFVSHDRHSQAPWILRYLKTPSVLLCQEPTRSYFEYFLRINPNMPVINRIYETINRYFRKNLEIENAKHVTKMITNSVYSMESAYRAYGVVSAPVYHGVDTSEHYPVKIKKENQVILIGNNEPQKALADAIESVALVNEAKRPTLVIISPRKVNNDDLFALAKKRKVSMQIMSGLTEKELREEYNKSIATLALAHLETFGLSVVEGMANGIPVIAVREGGYREIVKEGVTGLMVPRDFKLIAEAIEYLQKHKKLAIEMGKNGIIDANTNFSWDATTDEMEKVFYEATKNQNIRHNRKLQ